MELLLESFVSTTLIILFRIFSGKAFSEISYFFKSVFPAKIKPI